MALDVPEARGECRSIQKVHHFEHVLGVEAAATLAVWRWYFLFEASWQEWYLYVGQPDLVKPRPALSTELSGLRSMSS